LKLKVVLKLKGCFEAVLMLQYRYNIDKTCHRNHQKVPKEHSIVSFCLFPRGVFSENEEGDRNPISTQSSSNSVPELFP
jgi:hypothetical protein